MERARMTAALLVVGSVDGSMRSGGVKGDIPGLTGLQRHGFMNMASGAGLLPV